MDTLEKKEQMEKCKYCGKEFVWFQLPSFGGKNFNRVQIPQCNCLEEIEEKQAAEERAKEKNARLSNLYKSSMITPLFRKKTFEELVKHSAEYGNLADINTARHFADNFNPKTSKGMLLIGKVGTGKTTLQAAICNQLLNRGYACLFTTLSALLDRLTLHSYENAGDVESQLKALCVFDYIVIDDLGRETYTDKRKEIAFRLIDTLLNYEKVVSFTANPEMIAKLKTIPEWAATLDRIRDIAPTVWQFKGESLRGKNDRSI